MATTVETIKDYVGVGSETEYDDFIQACLDEATVLVDRYVGVAAVPDEIMDRAYLEVAADLFNRRNAPNGIMNQQYATVDGVGVTPMRIARDPMAAAYKILGRWVLPW